MVDRMIRAACDSPTADARLFENLGNGFVTAIARHFDEAALVETALLKGALNAWRLQMDGAEGHATAAVTAVS
jgi:hypothetical protein